MREQLTRPAVFPLVLALLLGAALAVPAAAEDLTIISTVQPAKGKPTTSTQYISSTKVRVSDGVSDSIVDISTGQLIFLDHKKKKYFETSFEEMRAHFAQLNEMLQSNPMLQKMIGDLTAVNVQETSETREVAGYSCRKYAMTIGKFQFDIWATTDLKPPIEYYEARKMLYATMGPMANNFEKMLDEMKKVGGMTLASVVDGKMMGMNMRSETTATEVRQGALPADAFEIPAGYKKGKSPYNN